MKFTRIIVAMILGFVLLGAGVFFELQVSDNPKTSYAIEKINDNLKRELTLIEDQSKNLVSGDTSAWEYLTHSFFLMDSVQIIRWNNNEILPDINIVKEEFSLKLLQWSRGTFLLKKWKLKDSKSLLAVVPLRNQFKINNRYLISGWNEDIIPFQDIQILESSAPEGYPFLWNGQVIFKLQVGSTDDLTVENILGKICLWIGLALFLAAFAAWLVAQHKVNRIGLVFWSFVVVFIGGRLTLLYVLSSPEGSLFDPVYFASSSYNRSIGDLLINMICLLIPITYLFFNYYRFHFVRKILSSGIAARRVWSIVFLLVCFFALLFPFLFFETIIHNSTISMDITQTLQFDVMRLVSFLAVILGSIAGFMLCHASFRLARACGKEGRLFYLALLIAGLLFWLYSLLVARNYSITISIGFIYLSLVSLFKLSGVLQRTSFLTFLYLFLTISIFAVQGSLAVKQFTEEERLDSQFKFANTFLIDRDFLGEYLLDESVLRISSDPFIQTRMGNPFLSKSVVRQKVKQVYLNSYFDKYDVKIHLFGPSGNSFDNSTELNFATWIQRYQMEANKTTYEGVYFVKNASAGSTKQYLVVIPISRFGAVTGYVILDLSLKRVIPGNVFPELLLDNRFVQYFENRNFSYAFYSNEDIVSSFGDFNYEKRFPIQSVSSKNADQVVAFEDYIHIIVEDEGGRDVVVSSPTYKYFNVITNFSFLFILGLIVVFLLLASHGIGTLIQGNELNYSAKIQLYVYLAFILPLALVSLSTMGLISRGAERQLNKEYRDKAKVLGDQIAPLLESYVSDSLDISEIDNRLIELSRLANVDASVFSVRGNLLSTSQPLIYEDKILSGLVNRKAWETIVRDKEISFIGNEQIGTLKYNSAYYNLKSPTTGTLLGMLSLPFFESAFLLEQTQINVLSNILVIFCIIFILFSLLSFFAVRWLIFPLQFITKTLGRTTLTGSNKRLTWKSNDEIGLMVSEYNRMLENLESSKIELSRAQKEAAWREIAKQVAHEVKNPLTPMKLTLQQMEQSLLSGGLEQEKAKKSVKTLLAQVEILNDIAASFSAFARMPAPILEKIEITSLLKRTVDLHAGHPDGLIELKIPNTTIYVMGDQQLLSRVFSNLLINGLQSAENGEAVTIEVKAEVVDGKCLITFLDNGNGIEEDLKDRIFLPHFSTKKSGSGIGLAIAKQGIEHNGGSIRFESELGMGTTFYVEIPVI